MNTESPRPLPPRRSTQHDGGESPGSFSVVCYNVLADNLLQDNLRLYRHCAHRHMDWRSRRATLLRELFADGAADIYCLQEVKDEHFIDFFEPALLERGFIGLYTRRTGDKEDGCAIFLRQSRFQLADSRAMYDLELSAPDSEDLNRDNIAQVRPSCCWMLGVCARLRTHASRIVCA